MSISINKRNTRAYPAGKMQRIMVFQLKRQSRYEIRNSEGVVLGMRIRHFTEDGQEVLK